MNVGRSYVVAVYLDARTNRVAAASRLGEYFDYDVSGVQVGQEVSLLVYGFSDRGAHVVVGGRHNGLIYSSETFQSLNIGDALTGFVSDVRSDNKLDIRLGRLGHDGRLDARSILIAALEKAGGTLPLGDKSDPDAIYDSLGISKKAFKAAVGQLFKAGRVTPGATTTTLLDPRPASDAES